MLTTMQPSVQPPVYRLLSRKQWLDLRRLLACLLWPTWVRTWPHVSRHPPWYGSPAAVKPSQLEHSYSLLRRARSTHFHGRGHAPSSSLRICTAQVAPNGEQPAHQRHSSPSRCLASGSGTSAVPFTALQSSSETWGSVQLQGRIQTKAVYGFPIDSRAPIRQQLSRGQRDGTWRGFHALSSTRRAWRPESWTV